MMHAIKHLHKAQMLLNNKVLKVVEWVAIRVVKAKKIKVECPQWVVWVVEDSVDSNNNAADPQCHKTWVVVKVDKTKDLVVECPQWVAVKIKDLVEWVEECLHSVVVVKDLHNAADPKWVEWVEEQIHSLEDLLWVEEDTKKILICVKIN